MHLVWFSWTVLLIAIWLVVFLTLPLNQSKKEMITVSLWTSLLGLTEPLFIPAYWNPPSLFDLAATTGFDIESFIFSFGIGGLATALYERFFPRQHVRFSPREMAHGRHRFHPFAILSAPLLFGGLLLFTRFNPIYCAVIALLVGGFLTWYCRPDLMVKMSVSGILFLAYYFAFFSTLNLAEPGYVQHVWNLLAISGILVVGIPIEELMFAFSFGFFWSSLYEHLTWQRFTTQSGMASEPHPD